MKIVLQRVSSASITVDESIVGDIGKGYVVLLGIGADDDCAMRLGNLDSYVNRQLNIISPDIL